LSNLLSSRNLVLNNSMRCSMTLIRSVQNFTSRSEPRSLSDADTVELTIFDFVTGYEIALNAMRLLPENYVLNIAGGCVPSTATIALWMQFTASYKLGDGPIASDMSRLRLSGVAALRPSGNRGRSAQESLLTRFYDRQWERHSCELRSPSVDTTTSARRSSRMPIRKGRSANTRSNAGSP
jgi:hypothetical protein